MGKTTNLNWLAGLKRHQQDGFPEFFGELMIWMDCLWLFLIFWKWKCSFVQAVNFPCLSGGFSRLCQIHELNASCWLGWEAAHQHVPSWKLTYSPPKVCLNDDVPFSRLVGYVSVPCEGYGNFVTTNRTSGAEAAREAEPKAWWIWKPINSSCGLGNSTDKQKLLVGGGFQDFLFSPLPGEMIQFDQYFSKGFKPSKKRSTPWKFNSEFAPASLAETEKEAGSSSSYHFSGGTVKLRVCIGGWDWAYQVIRFIYY